MEMSYRGCIEKTAVLPHYVNIINLLYISGVIFFRSITKNSICSNFIFATIQHYTRIELIDTQVKFQ